jgi:hypothetical protein
MCIKEDALEITTPEIRQSYSYLKQKELLPKYKIESK